ncbi:MAG TPA: hypothetical protein VEK73_14370 [Xanthobacteraceae bacterium]|nr:hypothetical protein [Xanthobacteraceae bacterium]
MATRKKAKGKTKAAAKRKKAPAAKAAKRKKTAAAKTRAIRKKPAKRAPVRTSPPKAKPAARAAAPVPARPPARPAASPLPRPPAQPAAAEQRIGVVTHYFSHLSVAILKLEPGASLRVGDTIHVHGHTTDFRQKVESLEIDHAPATEVGPNDDFGLKVTEHAREHDVVYKVRA